MDKYATALSLAKQIQYDCQDSGNITLNKDTLRIVLDAFVEHWTITQGKVRQGFEKVK